MDPYRVLGIPQSATDDEVKKAYRALSRKYHPDSNINNPNKEQAEEKFKQVQQAYKMIMDMRENGGSYGNQYTGGGYSGSGYSGSGYSGSYSQGGYSYGGGSYSDGSGHSQAMDGVREFINAGQYRDAITLLNLMPERTSLWYYYSAIANSRLGNNVAALRMAQMAYSMEPGNPDYAYLYSRLQGKGTWYQSMGDEFGRNGAGGGSLCCEFLAMNLFCNLCC